MSEQIVIRTRTQQYVVFGVIFGPIIILGVYAAVARDMSALKGVAAMGFLLLLMWWYLSTFKLIMTESAVVYKELWHTKEIPIGLIRCIVPGKLSGVSPAWAVHRLDCADITVIKVANFLPSELRRFAETLLERNPAIQILVLPKTIHKSQRA